MSASGLQHDRAEGEIMQNSKNTCKVTVSERAQL